MGGQKKGYTVKFWEAFGVMRGNKQGNFIKSQNHKEGKNG
jgi:hypothetical protein